MNRKVCFLLYLREAGGGSQKQRIICLTCFYADIYLALETPPENSQTLFDGTFLNYRLRLICIFSARP